MPMEEISIIKLDVNVSERKRYNKRLKLNMFLVFSYLSKRIPTCPTGTGSSVAGVTQPINKSEATISGVSENPIPTHPVVWTVATKVSFSLSPSCVHVK